MGTVFPDSGPEEDGNQGQELEWPPVLVLVCCISVDGKRRESLGKRTMQPSTERKA